MPATTPTTRRARRQEEDRRFAADRLASLGAAPNAGFVPARPAAATDGDPAAELLANLRRVHSKDVDQDGERVGHGRRTAGRRVADPVDSWRARVADRLPVALRGARWSVPLTAVVAVLALVAVAGVAVAVRTASAAPGVPVPARSAGAEGTSQTGAADTPAAQTPAAAGQPPATAPTTSTPGASLPEGEVVVHVVGQVATPGLVRLPAGARVDDALTAAGGTTAGADLGRVNLARLLVDGEQVHVPLPGEVVVAPAAPGGPAASDGGAATPAGAGGDGQPVSLNRATLADLDALPGIGPVLAQRILDWRQQNGSFSSVDELGEVTGIGDRVLEQLRPLVTV